MLLQQGTQNRAAILVSQHGLKPWHEFNLLWLHDVFLKNAKTVYF